MLLGGKARLGSTATGAGPRDEKGRGSDPRPCTPVGVRLSDGSEAFFRLTRAQLGAIRAGRQAHFR